MIAGFNLNEVAGNQIARRDRMPRLVTDDSRVGDGQFLQGCERLLRSVLLHEPKQRVQEHNGQDGAGIDPFPEQARDDGSRDQDPDDHAGELRQEDTPGRNSLGLRQFVGT
jgi:hypothetical protein